MNKLSKVQSIPPMINIIGEVFNVQKVYLDFDNIRYIFHSLAKAVDVAFKTYFTLLFVYPKACQAMWLFINKYFFKLEDEITPSCAHGQLMHHLKSK